MDREQERNILSDIKGGSTGSFSMVYDYYSPTLYQLVYRMVKDDDQTKEILQETFIRVWTSRHSIDVDKPFKYFIYTIAKNLVHDYFRLLAKERSLQEQLIQRFSESSYFEDEVLNKKKHEDLIEDMLQQLPEQRRTVYTLCKIERKSYKEVGEILSISTSTVSDHMTKANKLVKEYLLKNKSRLYLSLISWFFHSI